MYSAPASQVDIHFRLKVSAFALSSACGSSNHAIAQAALMLRHGLADIALSRGTEACFSLPGIRAWEAMRLALRDACLIASDIDYINAHGTGTQLNDSTETRAMQDMCGSEQLLRLRWLERGAGVARRRTCSCRCGNPRMRGEIRVARPGSACAADGWQSSARRFDSVGRQGAFDAVVEAITEDDDLHAYGVGGIHKSREARIDLDASDICIKFGYITAEQRDLAGHAFTRSDQATPPLRFQVFPAKATEPGQRGVGDISECDRAIEIAQDGPIGFYQRGYSMNVLGKILGEASFQDLSVYRPCY